MVHVYLFLLSQGCGDQRKIKFPAAYSSIQPPRCYPFMSLHDLLNLESCVKKLS